MANHCLSDEADCDSIRTEEFVDYVKAMHADSDSGFARSYEVCFFPYSVLQTITVSF